jgi:hypothetical protein
MSVNAMYGTTGAGADIGATGVFICMGFV